MTNSEEVDPRPLAAWVRQLSLADQVFLTGSTLLLERIRLHHGELAPAIDEGVLREGSPREALAEAQRLRAAFSSRAPLAAADSSDDSARVVGLARALADLIERAHPELSGGRS